MPPRPLYSWKSFWLGVLVIASLGWTWVRSMEGNYEVAILTPEFEAGIGNHDGGLFFGANRCSSPWGVRMEAYPLEIPARRIFTLWEMEASGGGVEIPGSVITMPHVHARVAHWLIILAFLLPWSAFLAWRWRRVKRGAMPPLD